MADADGALARLGAATVVGRGLGACVGLLLAGARPKQVRGLILLDGPGLAGGGMPAKNPYAGLAALEMHDPALPAPAPGGIIIVRNQIVF